MSEQRTLRKGSKWLSNCISIGPLSGSALKSKLWCTLRNLSTCMHHTTFAVKHKVC